jgi:chloramphenicol-sensitive protein RarD
VLTVGFGSLPWIALVLSISWASYSLIKKKLNLGALETLTVETLFAFLPNFIYLIWLERNKEALFGEGLLPSLLLLGAGLATVAPLLLFNGATTRLPLSTVGLLQYITPTMMFFIGVFINGEDMATTKLIGFAFIWAALAFLSRDLFKSSRTIDDSVAKVL